MKYEEKNRLHNATNPAQRQDKFPTCLCVCSAGLLRSPTMATLLSRPPYNFNTRAAGSNLNWALIPLSNVLIRWASIILFANDDNLNEAKINGIVIPQDKTVVVLNIPDNFEFMEDELVGILEEKFKTFIKIKLVEGDSNGEQSNIPEQTKEKGNSESGDPQSR